MKASPNQLANLKRGGSKGRTPGVPNKVTYTVRECLAQSITELGGAAYFVKLARSRVASDRAAYTAIIGKIIPTQIEGDLKAAIEIIHRSE